MFDPRELYFVTRVQECKKFGIKPGKARAQGARGVFEKDALCGQRCKRRSPL